MIDIPRQLLDIVIVLFGDWPIVVVVVVVFLLLLLHW